MPITKLGVSKLALLAVVAFTASCDQPRSGPGKSEIFAGSVMRQGNAFIVSVTPRVSQVTKATPALGFSHGLRNASLLPADTIRSGDIVTLSVYENVTEGLLAGTETPGALLEELQVDADGFIFVPYAGRIRAAGQTPDALRRQLTRQLDEQTPDPQVIVRRTSGDGTTVSVLGAVTTQGVYPIERPTRSLTAMLAQAGGVNVRPEIAQVRVTRGRQQDTVWLQDLFDHPQLDIALRGGDRILVEADQRSFTAMGATGRTERITFDSRTVSGIEALASVGGLDPSRADPTGVFVFRDEPPEIANALLGRNDLIGDQRFVYVLDLTAPTGMFEARDFAIRDKDTVYVTEASAVGWARTIASLTGTLATATSVRRVFDDD